MKIITPEQTNYIYTHKHLTAIISKRGKRWKLDIKSTKEAIENKSKIWSTKKGATERMNEIFAKY